MSSWCVSSACWGLRGGRHGCGKYFDFAVHFGFTKTISAQNHAADSGGPLGLFDLELDHDRCDGYGEPWRIVIN
jgi:hypothetical protein